MTLDRDSIIMRTLVPIAALHLDGDRDTGSLAVLGEHDEQVFPVVVAAVDLLDDLIVVFEERA
ncbi:hypothetical protein WQO_18955 [Streptomyces globisporus C-1027]|uniref:Uncharacterized protein n=1 Tax=Streptomyces globisporus C-1027 TaxID=1172567 RepID=A0A0U3MF41_STRGL|nr:hypothetical protein WQO_18955 [Streptomyces globisporus C-1027]